MSTSRAGPEHRLRPRMEMFVQMLQRVYKLFSHRIGRLRLFGAATITVIGGHYLWFFIDTASLPLLDAHGFRQTQTAISVWYMLNSSSWLIYPTPVLGYPWIIPFEAPVYQWTVALLASFIPFELDTVGRITSSLYLLGGLAIGFLTLRRLFPRPTIIPSVFVALMIASPLYAFWSRTFMIETASVFWGCVFVYGVGEFSHRPRVLTWAIGFTGCLLCGLAKATTWPGFAIAAGALYAYQWREQLRSMLSGNESWWLFRRFVRDAAPLVSMVFVTAIVLFAWVEISDTFKSLSEIGRRTTSDSLQGWNFGPLEQRYSSQFWVEIVLQRALPEALGLLWFVPIGMIAMKIGSKRHLSISAACVCLFLVPMMLFTNLHIRHDYYQVSNSIFLIAAAAIVMGGVIDNFSVRRRFGWLAAGVLVLVLLSQYLEFYKGYHRMAVANSPEAIQMQVALGARNLVAEDTALVVFGLDWSSEMHYYAQRKGIAFPHWAPAEHIPNFRHTPERYFGELPLGGIIDCRMGFAANHADKEWYRNAEVLIADAVSRDLDGMTWRSKNYGLCSLHYRESGGAARDGPSDL